ncbi:MAG: hypothetical protein R3Y24_17570 [Eubacteriales bacterium]
MVIEMSNNQVQEDKKWFLIFLIAGIIGIGSVALITYIVDPYFHYHAPLEQISYRINEERYMNDGILENFEYQAVITGSSMTQNFKPSEWEALSGQVTVKVPYSGGGFLEISEALQQGIDANDEMETIIWGIDYNGLVRDSEWLAYTEYPSYLYDDNLFNDTYYLLNKWIFYHGVITDLIWTVSGQETTTLDEYGAWDFGYGQETVLSHYVRSEEVVSNWGGLSEESQALVEGNVANNIVELANENPDVTFELFYTPLSIIYWDSVVRSGGLEQQIEAEKIATELLLECDNINLYSYFNDYDLICNLDYYKDQEHYISEINSEILNWIDSQEGLVTKENYLANLEAEYAFYAAYDYDSIFE